MYGGGVNVDLSLARRNFMGKTRIIFGPSYFPVRLLLQYVAVWGGVLLKNYP